MKISSLHIYPIKSCAGIELTSSRVVRAGLEHDRMMAVVGEDGKVITQRTHPTMALIRPELGDGIVTLSAPNMESITIPMTQVGDATTAEVWGDVCDAIDQGRIAEQWFSDYLQLGCRLVAMNARFKRTLDPQYARNADDHAAFNDGYPILIASQASLDDLNSRLDTPVPMNRFRPNIILTETHAWGEDDLVEFSAGSVLMAGVKLCSRCVVTTINQLTLEKGIEPLRTMNEFRKIDGKIMFGQNVIPLQEGTITVGNEILTTGGG